LKDLLTTLSGGAASNLEDCVSAVNSFLKNLFFKSSRRVKRLDAEWKANQSPRVCQHLFDFLFEADSKPNQSFKVDQMPSGPVLSTY
jgi:hypothetical protein